MFSVALNYLSLATVFSVVLLLIKRILFAFCSYRMPWCVVTPDVAGAEWGTGHDGWRPTRWEEKQFGATQQHPRGPQQEQCGETQRNHLYKTLISSLTCGEDYGYSSFNLYAAGLFPHLLFCVTSYTAKSHSHKLLQSFFCPISLRCHSLHCFLVSFILMISV